MTTVTFLKSNGSYTELRSIGHAEYVKKNIFGKKDDILCASISVLMISTINALSDLCNEEFEFSSNEETGFIRCVFDKPLQEKSVFLLDYLYSSLKELSKEYGEKFLYVELQEVEKC